MKKVLIFLSSLVVALGSAFMLGSCKEEKPYQLPDDVYEMGEFSKTSFLIDIATGNLSGGLKKVLIEVGDKGFKSFSKSLGYEKMSDSKFRKDVIKKLDVIESEIVNIGKKADILLDGAQDKLYRERYEAFLKQYTESNNSIVSTYQLYSDLEAAIEEGLTVDVDKTVKLICNSVQGTETNVAAMDKLVAPLGYYFINDGKVIGNQDSHSIFSIVEHYATTNSVVKENIYNNIKNILNDSYCLYYLGTFLLEFNYSMRLAMYDVDTIFTGNDGVVYAYTLANNDKIYLNTRATEKDEFVKKYNPEFNQIKGYEEANLADYEPKLLISVDPQAAAAANNLATATNNFNTVDKAYNEMLARYEVPEKEDYFHIDVNDNKLEVKKNISTVDISTIISDGNLTQPVCDPTKYGYVTKKEFEDFAKRILPAAKIVKDNGVVNLTFREFFKQNGFIFPTNNEAQYLLVGVSRGFKQQNNAYSNYYHDGTCVALHAVNMDMKIVDFVNSPKYQKFNYCTVQYTESCKDRHEVVETTKEFFNMGDLEGPIGTSFNSFNKATTKFYTVFGLSKTPLTTKTNAMDMTF